MKIKSLHLKNFKRFTDLTLQDIPQNARLVLLIGSNGSGKSSVFDAFEVLNRHRYRNLTPNTEVYYSKNGKPFEVIADFGDGFVTDANKNVYSNGSKIPLTGYYGRTSFRQVPRLTRLQLGTGVDVLQDADKPYSFIDRDERFENDLEHLFGKLLKEFFSKDNDKSEIKETVITPINLALERIFKKGNGTKLELIELIPPLEGQVAAVNFKKGNSIFHYNQLSAGEKEIFNILINLISRKQAGNDIFYFDEIDLHLSTSLQYNFLKEIVEHWITEHCQFWTASHSLGFIQYAKESDNAIIFDFDNYDFDYSKSLSPEPKDSTDIYEIAVSKELLPALFADYQIIFVENEDRNYYASLNIDRTLFVAEKNRDGVFHKAKTGQFVGLVDRDFLTDEDIDETVSFPENSALLLC
jgi:predicted ATPase